MSDLWVAKTAGAWPYVGRTEREAWIRAGESQFWRTHGQPTNHSDPVDFDTWVAWAKRSGWRCFPVEEARTAEARGRAAGLLEAADTWYESEDGEPTLSDGEVALLMRFQAQLRAAAERVVQCRELGRADHSKVTEADL